RERAVSRFGLGQADVGATAIKRGDIEPFCRPICQVTTIALDARIDASGVKIVRAGDGVSSRKTHDAREGKTTAAGGIPAGIGYLNESVSSHTVGQEQS